MLLLLLYVTILIEYLMLEIRDEKFLIEVYNNKVGLDLEAESPAHSDSSNFIRKITKK